MELLIQLACAAAVIVAVGMVVIGLPGTILILATAAIYGFATHFAHLTPYFLLILFALSAFGEVADNLIGVYWAKRTGSSWLGVFGSILGAIVGAAIGSAVAPIVGTIVGGLVGSFAGAFALEYHKLRDSRNAVRAGWGAFAGRMAGILLKLVIALVMGFLFLQRVF